MRKSVLDCQRTLAKSHLACVVALVSNHHDPLHSYPAGCREQDVSLAHEIECGDDSPDVEGRRNSLQYQCLPQGFKSTSIIEKGK